VSDESPRLFRSTGVQGYSEYATSHPSRVFAHKSEREVYAEFTPVACVVQTSEGQVHAKAGDAILTGSSGERCPVSRAGFAQRYRAIPPTTEGRAGRYVSLPKRVVAIRMDEPFEVLLLDGVSRLRGRAEDWLIDYGDGSLGVISPAIFAATYHIEE
jgi:hypothetical protein